MLKENFENNETNDEKNVEDTIEIIEDTSDTLEKTFVNPSLENYCDQCEFVGKNKRGLKIHKTAKHVSDHMNSNNLEIVTVNVFGLATEPNLRRNTDKYKDYLEIEQDAVFSVHKIWMTDTRQYKDGYLGKYLPLEIELKTSVASLWKSDSDFRKDIFENVNKNHDVGKIVEIIPEEEE